MKTIPSITIIQIPAIYIVILLNLTQRVESLIGVKVTAAVDRDFPFIASLQHYPNGDHFCTGTFIMARYVITTAHCLCGETPQGIRILLSVISSQSVTTRHTTASWLMYDHWAHQLGKFVEPGVFHDIAVVQLTNEVRQSNVHPVRLNLLHKKQIQGTIAIITGWKGNIKNNVLQKARINLLSDEKCSKKIFLITNNFHQTSSRVLCTAAKPYALSEPVEGDSGAPLLDRMNTLLGVGFADCPDPKYTWGNFSDEFLKQYQVNLHFSIDYYRNFIVSATEYHWKAMDFSKEKIRLG